MSAERESVLHSWCVQSQWNAPTVVGGSGAHLHLADGRRILDMSSLAECSNLGHQHPRVVEAIREQAGRLCFVTNAWGAAARADLADRLLEVSGFEGGRVFFTLGGADANENAVKIARQAMGRPRGIVVTRDRSYHGSTYLAMALSGDTRTRASRRPRRARRQPRAAAVCVSLPLRQHERRALWRARGCRSRRPYRPARRRECRCRDDGAQCRHRTASWRRTLTGPRCAGTPRERGIPLIADEVMSGFGRCGEWFAWQRHGVAARPDMMTLAKGLTGAMAPLGAVVLSRAMAARIDDQMLYAGLTYCGHPLSCAAGIAAIDAYREEGLIERSRWLGAQLKLELERLQSRHAVIGDVRGGHGLFARARTGDRPASRASRSRPGRRQRPR